MSNTRTLDLDFLNNLKNQALKDDATLWHLGPKGSLPSLYCFDAESIRQLNAARLVARPKELTKDQTLCIASGGLAELVQGYLFGLFVPDPEEITLPNEIKNLAFSSLEEAMIQGHAPLYASPEYVKKHLSSDIARASAQKDLDAFNHLCFLLATEYEQASELIDDTVHKQEPRDVFIKRVLAHRNKHKAMH